jgi:hypothetical protein
MGQKVECPKCSKKYKALGMHWSKSSCSPPKLTNYQKEIITGVLMGDGGLDLAHKTPKFQICMISKKYLEYLDDIFGSLTTGVKIGKTAKECAEKSRESGFNPNAKERNYSDQYWLKSRSLPELEKFNWYESGKKVWPENINLTPTVLKHWYVGDGTYVEKHGYIKIAMANEISSVGKVSNYFDKSNIPKPNGYDVFEKKNGNKNCQARFTKQQSKKLFEYMGDPLPDFKYKWPKKHR